MKWYGLLGKTLKHSFSKAYFTAKFNTLGITDCKYENFELASIDKFPELLRHNPLIKGLNVTIPYKEEVLPFLDVKNDIVEQVNACNTIKISNGKLSGYNTDVVGFQQSLQKLLEPYHANALILGTGGASKAVQYALKSLHITYQNVSRTKSTTSITYDELNEATLSSHQLIINTSPIGMFPNLEEAPPIPFEFVTPKHLLFDLIYNPAKTLFLTKGEEKGAKIANGMAMLVLQAEESWKIWNSDKY
jgi:shikimate dehydrogenase